MFIQPEGGLGSSHPLKKA